MKRKIIIILSVALFCATLYYLANRPKEDKFKKSEPAKREVIDWGEPDNTIKDPLEGLDEEIQLIIYEDALKRYLEFHEGN